MTATPRDELRATTQGETSRAKARCHELAALLEGVAGAVGDATQSKDPAVVAERLQEVVLAGAVVLDELGGIAGRLDSLARG
jgi:hypothetical protein